MGDVYIAIADIVRAAGCEVRVNDINEGWERRSRSSGGFDAAPLGVQWHHTASSASVNSDLSYMINGSPDEPVGNVLIDRDGIWWPIAGGAANTSGKGGPNTFSRGTCPKDSGNTRLFSLEIANGGTGEEWPQVQIDSAFRGSNALNAAFGNQADDVVTHALGLGDGYTDRKIDPATAAAVQGAWRPGSANSSGTWILIDLQAECRRRAGSTSPSPVPPLPGPGQPGKVTDMYVMNVSRHGWPAMVTLIVAADGIRWPRFDITWNIDRLAGAGYVEVTKEQTLEMLGDRPGIGPCPFDGSIPDYADPELAAAW
jgi:hypothetical protein